MHYRCCQLQLYIGSGSNSLVIKSGETFSYDGLSLTPSSDFTLSNTTLTRTDAQSITPTPTASYISRYFSFSSTTPAFAGTIRFSYAGATLSPLSAGSLELNIRANATQWVNIPGTDNGSSYVEANLTVARNLNTLTLGSDIAPLPVNWLKFSAVQKDNTALLNWITATEQNAQDFLIEHSTTGEWQAVGVVKAAGNSASPSHYTYVHQSPKPGYNHYRLLQRDADGSKTYSGIATVLMGEGAVSVSFYPNPVQKGEFVLNVAEAQQVELYDASGRKVISQYTQTGSHVLNVSELSGGVYYLRAGGGVFPVIVP